MEKNIYTNEAIDLLQQLIAIPSVSREETAAADALAQYLTFKGLQYQRKGNNIWVINNQYNPSKPTILLNAHIDTVKPVDSWQKDPFTATIENDFLYGLGSNDCGGGLVTLLQVYRYLTQHEQSYNLVYLASAEEEVSGINGIRSVLNQLPVIDVAIVGEPTGMQPAIAEKGLMVVDGYALGKSGHAARNEGINAIYKALADIQWFKDYQFEKVSDLLGPVKMSVTMISAGTQHNVIPEKCHFTVDIRTNEYYSNQEVYQFICQHVSSKLTARSFHLSSSHIDRNHPLIQKCIAMGLQPFGSPTLSDQALMGFPSFKLGPGESKRSHSADEFIKLSEIRNAFDTYVQLLDGMVICPTKPQD